MPHSIPWPAVYTKAYIVFVEQKIWRDDNGKNK